MNSVTPELLHATEEYVRHELSSARVDASHDWYHISRVRNMVKHLAAAEGLPPESTAVADLAALLHDVKDWKYTNGDAMAAPEAVQGFLQQQGCGDALVSRVLSIIASVGFKEELAVAGSSCMTMEAKVVQDADRLDAIGAVGIARCFTFGGHFNRVLYDPDVPPQVNLTKEQYMVGAAKSTTINHFYEKLLTLKDKMKTATGRKLAEERHQVMEAYLEQFLKEWQGEA